MEIPWHDRRPLPRSLLVVAGAAALLAAIAMLVIDRPVARALAPYEPLPVWTPVIEVLDHVMLFPLDAHALPVLLVAAMLAAAIVKPWRGGLPPLVMLAGVHLASRYATGWLKDLTGRIRPAAWLASADDATFGWVKGDAFPSGHVVLWAALGIPLAVMYPRLRPVLVVVAFVACARVGVAAHWVSDTLAAIALVALVTWLVGALARPLTPPA